MCDNSDSSFTSAMIKNCFNSLDIPPYSNISSYLSNNSKGKDLIFVKSNNGYRMSRSSKLSLSESLQTDISPTATNNLISITIFESAPFYLKKIAIQMSSCYDSGLYDACLVMMRKLIETLIIECFESHRIDDEIKDHNGYFLYMSDLIPLYINSNKWNVSRNCVSSIEKVKKYGDLSAHNRRFIANRHDLDSFKFELRQAVEEIINTIGYSKTTKN